MSAREGRVLEPSLLVPEEACREREEEEGVWPCVSLDDKWSEGGKRWKTALSLRSLYKKKWFSECTSD